MILLGLLVACGAGGGAPTAPALPPGWLDTLRADPARFEDAVGAHREGWAALHRGDLGAAEAAGGPPAVRARAELARIGRALRGVAGPPLQGGAPARVFAALSAAGWGEPVAPLGVGPEDPLHTVAAAAAAGGLPAVAQTAGAIGECARAHLAVRAGGPLGALAAACPDPLWVGPEGAQRDPWVLSTLAALGDTAVPPPVALPFSAAWAEADVGAPFPGPSLRALGWSGDPDHDLPALDAALEAPTSAEGPGAALIAELRLGAVWRAHVLAAAWEAAPGGAEARWLAWAVDPIDGRGPGPARPPLLLAAEAAQARAAGHSRAALDALHPLADALPVLTPVREALADAAAAESLGRDGLSFTP